MPRYIVYGIMNASVIVGEYEADNELEACDKADADNNANWMPSLCHQCSREKELGDVYETQAELIED